MYTVNIQFHMLFEELLEFTAKISKEYNLALEFVRWHPKMVCEIPNGSDVKIEAERFGQVDCIWLLYKPKRAGKIERFMLGVGTMRGRLLKQAHLGAGTKSIESYAVLKNVAAELRHRTKRGVWVTTTAGNVGLSRTFRISPGAADASRRGELELTNVAFTQSMSPDPPAEQTSMVGAR